MAPEGPQIVEEAAGWLALGLWSWAFVLPILQPISLRRIHVARSSAMRFRSVFGRFRLQPSFCGATATARRARSAYSKAASCGGDGQILSEGTEAKAQAMEKKFWMRDPSTGDWVPEDHIGRRVDAAELREKLLSGGKQTI